MPAIGIDLGTTYSCVSVSRPNKDSPCDVIPNQQGKLTTPSCVAFTERDSFVGEAAKHQLVKNPKNTIFGIKRIIGRSFTDAVVQEEKANWPFDVIGIQGKTKIQFTDQGRTKTLYPEEISAIILEYMKKIAEAFTGEQVHSAVITVPAYFNNSQRSATKNAAAIAGLHVLGMINEPTAAAIAYGLQHKIDTQRNILVFDLGGGTFDATVMTVKDGLFDVQATIGDGKLGGEDFNNRLFEHLVNVFKRTSGKDLRKSEKAKIRVMKECEAVKRFLSSGMRTEYDA